MELFTRLLALLLLLLAPAAAQLIPLSPEFSQNEYSSTEGDSVRVCLNIPQLANSPFNVISCTIVVNVEAIDGTALQGVDYSLSSGGSSAQVSFTAGDAISSCFYVNLTRDCMVEGDESFELAISDSSITGQCSAFYAISELATVQFDTSDHSNDVMVVSFTKKQELVFEGEDPQRVEITACSSGCTYSVPIQISAVCNPTGAVSVIPATSPEDFVAPDSFSFVFTSFGQYNSCADNSLFIRITDDEIPEPLESFICSLQSGSTQSVRSEPPEQITIDIVDNDELVVNWAKDFYSFDESSPAPVELITNAAYSIGFTLVGNPVMISSGFTNMPVQSTVVLPGFGRLTQPFRTVVFRNTTYQVANVGTASGRGVFRTVPSFVFSPPALSAVSSLTSVDDDICEMDQLYMAVFEPLATTGFTFRKGHPNVTYIVIEDDDVTEIAFTESNKTVNEAAGSISITLTTTGAFYGPLDVVIECFTDSATSADFGQGQYSTRFFVNDQVPSMESTITIPITDDSIVEGTECFVCSIVDVIGLPCARPASEGTTCNICIEDDEEDDHTSVNDTVIGDPLFTIPLPSQYVDDDKLKGSALCFEYHGHSGEHYNLISDSCVSVNTLYSAGVNKSKLNVMSEIGIRAEDSAGGCHTISVLREGCSASLNGAPVTGTVSRSGVVITARRSRVRVSLPNCESQKRLTLWVLCNRRNNEDMLEIVVSRGDGLRPTAHGLIGQFWNVPMSFEPYTGLFGGKEVDKDDGVYLVHVAYPGSQPRTFVAWFRPRSWDFRLPCLYVGNSLAGPVAEAPQYRDNVIDGEVNSYNVDNLFTTDYQHSQYESDCQ